MRRSGSLPYCLMIVGAVHVPSGLRVVPTRAYVLSTQTSVEPSFEKASTLW